MANNIARADVAAIPSGTAGLWPLVTVCTLVYLLDGLVHSILGPVAPQMAAALALTPQQLGTIFSANLIGQSIGLILFPVIATRFGNRTVVLITSAGFGVFELASGFVQDGDTMFSVRLLTGFFLGGALPTCLAIVSAVAPTRRRGIMTMILFTGYGGGATLAGLAVPVFGEDGWRSALIFVGACCLVTAVCVWIWLRPSEDVKPEPTDVAGIAARNPFAIFGPRLLLGTILLWVLFIALLTISYCLNSWLPSLLVEVGHDQSIASLAITTFSLGGIIAALGVGVLIDRYGATVILTAFLTIAALMLAFVGQILATSDPTTLLVLLGICGFFVLGAYGGVNVVLAGYFPAPVRAVGIGWTKSVSRVGTIIAPILIGYALANGMAGTAVMSLFAAPAVLAALAVLGVGWVERRSARVDAATATAN
jgi:AAHS family 4-hydroxybenzoate transporter-like MFS transporter